MTARPAYRLRCPGLSDRVITPLVQTELRWARWWIRNPDPKFPANLEARLRQFWYAQGCDGCVRLDEALATFEYVLASSPARLPADRPWTMVHDNSVLTISGAAYAGPDPAAMVDVVVCAPTLCGALVVAGWLREAPADVPWQVILPIVPKSDRGPMTLIVRLPSTLFSRLHSIAFRYACNQVPPLVGEPGRNWGSVDNPQSIAVLPTRPDGRLFEDVVCETIAGLAPLALEGDDEDCEAIMRWVRVAWQHVRPLLPHLRLWTIDAPWTMRS